MIHLLSVEAFADEMVQNKGAVTLLMSPQTYDEGILGKSGSSRPFIQAIFSLMISFCKNTAIVKPHSFSDGT